MTNMRKDPQAPDVDWSGVPWRTSTRSGGNGSCVEVADVAGAIVVRDSKDRQGPVLLWNPSEWRKFVKIARANA